MKKVYDDLIIINLYQDFAHHMAMQCLVFIFCILYFLSVLNFHLICSLLFFCQKLVQGIELLNPDAFLQNSAYILGIWITNDIYLLPNLLLPLFLVSNG